MKMASSKKNKQDTDPYQIVGYMSPYDNRSIISAIVLECPDSGMRFTATMCEVMNMVQNGKVKLPPLDTAVAAQ